MSFCSERDLNENNQKDKKDLYDLWNMKRTEMLTMQYRGIDVNNYNIIVKGSPSEASQLYPFPDAKKLFIENTYVPVNGKYIELVPTFKRFLDERREAFNKGTPIFKSRSDFNAYYINPNGKDMVVLYVVAQENTRVKKNEFEFLRSLITECIPTGISVSEGQNVTNVTHRFNHIMIVSKNKIGHINADTMKQSLSVKIEHMYDDELYFPAFRHALAPKATNYYPPNSVNVFNEKEGISHTKLPNILFSDIQTKFLNGEVGGVLETLDVGTDTETIWYARTIRTDINVGTSTSRK